jgi:hypothetical protein
MTDKATRKAAKALWEYDAKERNYMWKWKDADENDREEYLIAADVVVKAYRKAVKEIVADPDPPSLWHGVNDALDAAWNADPRSMDEATDAVLAVVRRHVEADTIPGSIHGREIMYRDDVLRLLDGADE